MMYFKPRDSRFYSFALKIKPVSRYMFTGFIIGMFTWLWLFFIYFPISARINCMNGRCDTMRQQYETIKCATRDCKKIEQHINELQAKIDIYKTKNDALIFCPISYITTCAQKTGLHVTTCALDKTTNYDWYMQQSFSFNSSGSMKKIISFFDELAQSSLLFSYDNFSLVRLDDDLYTASCSLLFHNIR